MMYILVTFKMSSVHIFKDEGALFAVDCSHSAGCNHYRVQNGKANVGAINDVECIRSSKKTS